MQSLDLLYFLRKTFRLMSGQNSRLTLRRTSYDKEKLPRRNPSPKSLCEAGIQRLAAKPEP